MMAADLQALRAMLDVIDWQAQKYPSIGRTVTLLRDAIEEIEAGRKGIRKVYILKDHADPDNLRAYSSVAIADRMRERSGIADAHASIFGLVVDEGLEAT